MEEILLNIPRNTPCAGRKEQSVMPTEGKLLEKTEITHCQPFCYNQYQKCN